MASVAALLVADGQTTPVTHTFSPAKTTSDYVLYENRVSGQYIGYEKLTISMQRPRGPSNQANRNLKYTVKLEAPVLESIGTSDSGLPALPTVAHRPTVEVIFTFSERATKQQRKDMRYLAWGILANAGIGSEIDDLSVPY